jgi:hypothetical protein
MFPNFKVIQNKRPDSPADGEYNRGILQIRIPELAANSGDIAAAPPQKLRVVMYGSIDSSGSMGEYAIAGNHNASSTGPKTKMDFVHATLINMVEYIVQQSAEFPHVEFYLAIVKFHSRANCVLLPTRVTPDNRDAIIQTIQQITPTGGTNFMKCFTEMSNLMSLESTHIPRDESISEEFVHRIHLFLTDGSNNEGEKGIQALTSALNVQFQDATHAMKQPTHVMVGYGTDHDSTALSNLCAQFPDSKQWFIDDIEKTGCIFGEILWAAVNAAYTGVKLISNIEFYDFATMKWTNDMSLGDFAYDSSRTFYARIPWNVDSIECSFEYTSMENIHNQHLLFSKQIEYVGEGEPATIDPEVEKELWRLDTIITIDESLKFFKNMRYMPHNARVEEKDRLLGVVTEFQEKFLAYATGNNLTEDPFIIQLADDLFVCINGLMAMNIGERYVAARQTSQIQQRAVTINDITPLQSEIIQSMPPPLHSTPSAQHLYSDNTNDYITDDCYYQPPPPPMRPLSSGDSAPVELNPSSPKTPKGKMSMDNDEVACVDAAAAAAATAADDKIVSDFTPSSRGIGSRLRHLSRDAIIGMYHRNGTHGQYYDGEDEYYSAGYIGDDTFSSHASPACARIGRMLSAPYQPKGVTDRTPTAPF